MKKIKYGDAEIGVREKFSVESVSEALFEENGEPSNILNDNPVGNFKNPIEKYSVILDGSSSALPDETAEDITLGYWSEQVSGENNEFREPIVITLTSTSQIHSKGIMIEFDALDGIFSNNMRIDWLLNGEIISSKNFQPNNYLYFCENQVDEYNKIVLTFYSLSVPLNRLKIKSIEFGEVIVFLQGEIVSANISHACDISSITLPISTATIRLKTKRADSLNFAEQQKITVEVDGHVESTTYIKSAKRISNNVFNIETEDVISILNSTEYLGGIYNTGGENAVSAKDLMKDILDTANIGYEIAEDVGNVYLSGHLPITNCRDALQQVAFGCNAVILTAYQGGVKIVSYASVVNSPSKRIGLGRMKSQTIDDEKAITSVTISAKKYYKNESIQSKTIFEANGSYSIGDVVVVKAQNPCFDYQIAGGVLIEENANFVKFEISSNACKITAKEYGYDNFERTREVYKMQKPNPKKISGAHLIDYNNVDKLLDKCYNYYNRIRRGKMNIIDIDKIKIGDVVNAKAVFGKDIEGVVVSQTYSLIGNTFVKDTEIVGNDLNVRKYGQGVYGQFVYGS